MEIGNVLLRDAQYVWRERKALLVRDAVVLQLLKDSASSSTSSSSPSPPSRETFALDGRFTCEAVVVSSAHLHSVRLQDIHTGKEFLLDTRSRGKKQVWVELFKNVRRLDALQPILSTRASTIATAGSGSLETDAKRLQTLLRASKLNTPAVAGKFIRGADLEGLVDDDKNVEWIGDQLVQMGVLEPCCCACAQFNNGEFIYRVNKEMVELVLAADLALIAHKSHRNHQYHKSHSCLLTELIERVTRDFKHSPTLSGLEIVQLCVRNGVFNVPTGIAVATEMLQKGLIQPSEHADNDEYHCFAMDRVTSYVSGQPLVVATNDAAGTTQATATTGNSTSSQIQGEDFKRFCDEHRQLKERYNMMFYVFCVFCVLVLFDGWASALPGSVKLTVVAGLLTWLTLGDGSASLHINIRKSGPNSAVTAAFFASPEPLTNINNSSNGLQLKPIDPVGSERTKELTGDGSAEEPKLLLKADQPQLVQLTSAETKAREARVHSFRLAIAQAASMPYEATQVYTNDYLFSVMNVKDRAFSYAVTKIVKCLEWRVQYGVNAITLEDVQDQLTSGSMYWYGYDFQNRPILWVRGRLKDWKHMSQRRDAEIKAHIFLLEACSRELMPPGSTTYTVVTDSSKLGPSHMDLRLMHGLLDTCVANYPDRVGMVHAGPMTRFLTWVIPMLWPFLPLRLRHKVSFMSDCVKDLSKHMKTELIPKHLGGTADHVLRATPSSDPKEAMDVLFMLEQQKLRMKEIAKQ